MRQRGSPDREEHDCFFSLSLLGEISRNETEGLFKTDCQKRPDQCLVALVPPHRYFVEMVRHPASHFHTPLRSEYRKSQQIVWSLAYPPRSKTRLSPLKGGRKRNVSDESGG